MEKRVLTGAVLTASICFLAASTGMPRAEGQSSFSSSAPAKRILHSQPDFGKMPVNFIPNRGQLDERVAYYIEGKDKSIYFDAEGVTFALTKTDEKRASSGLEAQNLVEGMRPDQMTSPGLRTGRDKVEVSRWVVRQDFLGANPGVKPEGTDETGAVVSYFQGEPGNWKTGLSTCSRIVYANLWPGIDLVYTGTIDKLKYEFVVHPGANPSLIRLAYRGASSVSIDEKGSLVVSTPSGGFKDGLPVAYQDRAGKRVNVALAYKILDRSALRTDNDGLEENESDVVTCGFSVGEYDETESLILDPVILIYCGFVGGPSYDYGYGIAADIFGSAYITGFTYSKGTSFPTKVGPDLTFNGGSMDAFVAKLNPSGTAFIYCGYIGGSGNDYGYGIAVDSLGSAYITGYTSSTAATFPVAAGPSLMHHGLIDAFVAKINPRGTALDYCGYIGGSGNDYARSIAVDGLGNAYITGYTTSKEATFPVSGALDLSHNGLIDAFVAKINPRGTALDYCGYIGGSGNDYGYGIAVDSSGNAYVTGFTSSTEATFPVSVGPGLIYKGGLYDAFVAKVNADGSALDYCGYVGGSGYDYGCGIAVDLLGDAYITGYTSSTESSFPVSIGPNLTSNGGYYDAFVAKVNAEGSYLSYCGFIGGSAYDAGTGIAVDGWGYAYVTGYTSSREDTFPVKEGPDLTHNLSFDAFVAKVDSSGTELVYCSFIGGADADLGMGIALDADGSGNVFLTGNTYSNESTFPVAEGPDFGYNGNRDGFVALINENSITVTAPKGAERWHVGFTYDITWLTEGKVGNVKIQYSTDTGETWIEIVASTENDGSYTWMIPGTESETCLVRISDVEKSDLAGTSKAVFTITNEPIIILTSPNGGEQWPVGSTQFITWITGGTVGDVKLEYSTDSATTWIEIVASTENDGSYTWVVPDAVSDTCLIRISEAEDGIPVDTNNALFSIVPATRHPSNKQRTAKSGGPN